MKARNTKTRNRPRDDYRPEKYNLGWQEYKGVPIKLILYTEPHFAALRAKRYLLGRDTGQNVWIPNSCLEPDGTVSPNKNIDFVFLQAYRQNKFRHPGLAGIDPTRW